MLHDESIDYLHKAIGFTYCRVLNLIDLIESFLLRKEYDLVLIVEKRGELAAMHVAIFVNGGGKNSAVILAVPSREVGATAEKRDPKWSAGYYHGCLITECVF